MRCVSGWWVYLYPNRCIPFYNNIQKSSFTVDFRNGTHSFNGKLTKGKSPDVFSTSASPRILLQEAINRVWELEKNKSVSTLGSISPRSSLLISPGTGACIIRFEIHQESHVSWSPSTASTLPVFLIFQEPAERNANAMLAKSFHIYEAHTCAPRYLWAPLELGGGMKWNHR